MLNFTMNFLKIYLKFQHSRYLHAFKKRIRDEKTQNLRQTYRHNFFVPLRKIRENLNIRNV